MRTNITRSLSLFAALAMLTATSAAQTPTAPAQVNPNTGALLAPTAAAFKSSNSIEEPLTFSTGLLRSGNTITVPATQTQITGVGTLTSGALGSGFTPLVNARLANSTITIGGTSLALGGTLTTSALLDSIGATRGSLLYRGASGWAAATPGTSGYVWTSQGAGADPHWAASVGGGGAMIDSTANLIAGDGAGNGEDSGVGVSSGALIVQAGAISIGNPSGTAGFFNSDGFIFGSSLALSNGLTVSGGNYWLDYLGNLVAHTIISDAGTISSDGSGNLTAGSFSGYYLQLTASGVPAAPAEGAIYANSSDHHLYFYNGSAWVQLDN